MSDYKHEGGHKAPAREAGSRARRGGAPRVTAPDARVDAPRDGEALTFSSGELRVAGKNGAQTSVESRRALLE